MDTIALATRIASVLHGAADVRGITFLSLADLHVVVQRSGEVMLTTAAPAGTAAALLRRRPEMARVLEALRLRDAMDDAIAADALDSTILHGAIDRLACAVAPIIQDQLTELAPEPASPAPETPAGAPAPVIARAASGLGRAAGYTGILLGAALLFGLIRIAVNASHQTPARADAIAAAPIPVPVADAASAWQAAADAFTARNCDFADGSNRDLLQAWINATNAVNPALSDADLLERSAASARQDDRYQPVSCP